MLATLNIDFLRGKNDHCYSMISRRVKNTYTIEEVAEAASVNSFTLRNWEDRYHLFTPERDANGRRIFSELETLRAICASELVKRDFKIGKIATSLLEASDPTHVLNAHLETGYFLELRKNTIDGLLKFDPTPARMAFDYLISNFSIDFLADHFFYPVFRMIETLQSEEKITQFQASFSYHHLTSRIHRLIGLVELNKRRNPDKKIMLCGLPGNLYEASFLIIYVALERDGWTVIYGGKESKVDELAETAMNCGAQAMIMAGNNLSVDDYAECVPAIEKIQIPVVIGGRVSTRLQASGLNPSENVEWSSLYPGPLARLMSYKLHV